MELLFIHFVVGPGEQALSRADVRGTHFRTQTATVTFLLTLQLAV